MYWIIVICQVIYGDRSVRSLQYYGFFFQQWQFTWMIGSDGYCGEKRDPDINFKERSMAMETIISACISAGVTLVICLLNNHGQQEKTRALMEYKLDELTKRVDKHNNVVERTYSIEQRLSVQEEQIRVANHRISDLEGIEHEH